MLKIKNKFFYPNYSLSCIVCKSKTNSHLMIDCDTCANIYHINCLDPPLGSVPKKTKLYGWECVACVQKKQNSDEESVKNEADSDIKRLRRERKQRILNTKSESSESPKKKIRRKSAKMRKNELNEKNNEIESQNSSVILMSDRDLDISVKKSIDSDSEAIYILDDESESPKGKFKSTSVWNKNIRAFKALPVDSGNEAENETSKRSRNLFKNSLNEKEEIENSVGDKLADSPTGKKETLVKSPNLKTSNKIK